MTDEAVHEDAVRLLSFAYDAAEGEEDVEVDLAGLLFEAGWTDAHFYRLLEHVKTNHWGYAVELSPESMVDEAIGATDAFDEDMPSSPGEPDEVHLEPRGFALTDKGIVYIERLQDERAEAG